MDFPNAHHRHSKLLGCLRSGLLFSSGILLSCGQSEIDRPRLDFNRIEETVAVQQDDSVLRVAVAAMTSPQETFHVYNAVMEYIGQQTGRHIQFVQRQTYAEINDLLVQGKLDLAFICTGAWVDLEAGGRVDLLAVPLIRGKDTYRSYLVVPENSPVRTIGDLENTRFACTDSLSLTGCWFPMAELQKLNRTPSSFFSTVVFTHGHDRSIRAVADGMVDAACVDGLVYDFLLEKNPRAMEGLRVAQRSLPFGMPPVVVPAALPPEFRDTLRRILVTMHESNRGQQLLDSLRIDRFVEPSPLLYESVKALGKHRLAP